MPDDERTTLGPYRLLRRLDAGGMSTVYEAEDPRLGRRVALKTLPDLWARDAEQLRRFRREATTLASLNHPGIVTIYSVEEVEGLLFLTMEWVDGEPLSKLIPETGLKLDTFFDYALQIADALEAAHQRDVIHRDIKPGNIMVTPTGRIKVLDFGLAKRRQPRQEELQESQTQTREGQMVGTLPYMSPEQLQGSLIDHRSDIFSFGIVLYEMVTGARPFQGESWGDLASAILRDDPPSVSEVSAHLPRHLGRILRHCLEKDVKRRFQTLLDLRNELAELHRELTTGELPSGTGKAISLDRRITSRRRRWWLAGTAGLALGVALGVGLWPRGPDPIEQSVASKSAVKRVVVLPFTNLGPAEEAYFATGVTEEISSRLAQVSSLRVVSRRSLADDEVPDADFILEGSVRWNDAEVDGSQWVRVTPRLVRVADGTQLWSQTFDRVLDDLFSVQSEIASGVIRQMDIVLLETERQALTERSTTDLAAYQAYLRGMDLAGTRNPTISHWQETLENFERAVELDPSFALAWAELSEVHSLAVQLGLDPTGKAERIEKARQAAARALELKPELPEAHRAFGYYYYWCHHDYQKALECFRVAAKGTPNDSQVLGGMAFVWRRMGRFEEAAKALRQALDFDPDSAWLASELGDTLRRLRRYPEADQYYSRAIKLDPGEPSAFQQRCQNLILWRGDLAGCRQILQSMPKQAENSSRLAWYNLEILEGHWQLAAEMLDSITTNTLINDWSNVPLELLKARVLEALGHPSEAEGFLGTAQRRLDRQLEKDPENPLLLIALAEVYAQQGKTEASEQLASHAATLVSPETDAIVGPGLLLDCAAIHAHNGRAEEAIRILEKLLVIPGDVSPWLLRLEPRWAPLRDQGAFKRLVVATGADEAATTS